MPPTPPPHLLKLAKARPPLWNTITADCIHDLCFAPHGHTLYVANAAGEFLCLETKTGKPRWQHLAHPGGALWIAPHPTLPLVVTGGQDPVIKLWEANRGGLLHSIKVAERGWVEHGAWSADGQTLAIASGKRLSFLTHSGLPAREPVEHSGTVLCLAWHPQQATLLAGLNGGVWHYHLDEEVAAEKTAAASACLAVSFSPNGLFIAAGQQEASLLAWPVGTTDFLRMAGYATKVRELAWAQDSSVLFTGGGYNVTTWDFRGAGPAGSTPEEFLGHAEVISTLAAHPHNPRWVASAAGDHFVFVWQVGAEHPVWVRALPQGSAMKLRWHPTGELLSYGGAEGAVGVWKVTL
jgi:WD40 repeat protein